MLRIWQRGSFGLGIPIFFHRNLLKISFKNHYSLEFLTDGRTDREAEKLYIYNKKINNIIYEIARAKRN
jgi:hypothetical protein